MINLIKDEAMNINRSTLCTAIVSLALAFPLAATAGIKATTDRSVRVDLSTLNLQAPEGQVTAYARMRHAAQDVCGAANLQQLGSVQRFMESQQCYEESLQRAVDRFGNEGVTRIHEGS